MTSKRFGTAVGFGLAALMAIAFPLIAAPPAEMLISVDDENTSEEGDGEEVEGWDYIHAQFHAALKKLIEVEGQFQNGDLFSTQWQASETIRGYLKSEYNPKRDERCKKARPDKPTSFN